MAKIRKIEPENYYHIYSRGVNKCKTFIVHEDYVRFQKYIILCNSIDKINLNFISQTQKSSPPLVEVFCYCLMPNHFHFILKEKTDGGISLFMQKILSGYVSYFNKKHKRTGSLFGSRFKDKLIQDDIYFNHLITYILNNPIKLIRSDYSSEALLKGEIVLSKEEILFTQNYPYSVRPNSV